MSTVQEVRGLSQLLENMKQLPAELVSRNGGPVRSNLFKAAKLVRDEARVRAPSLKKDDRRRKPGTIARNIVVIRDRDPKSSGANERYLVGVRKAKLSAAKKRALGRAMRGRGATRIVVVDDPFYWRFVEFGTAKMKAQPFLRPAFENRKQAGLETFRVGLAADIQKVVARMKK